MARLISCSKIESSIKFLEKSNLSSPTLKEYFSTRCESFANNCFMVIGEAELCISEASSIKLFQAGVLIGEYMSLFIVVIYPVKGH